jgi:hypothetical protein
MPAPLPLFDVIVVIAKVPLDAVDCPPLPLPLVPPAPTVYIIVWPADTA